MTLSLYALVMIFGALVAAIGLVLLFRKHEQQSLSRIRIFGQEFQFSAPGLVVTLAGCVLVVLLPVLGVADKDFSLMRPDKPFSLEVVNRPHQSFETAYPIKLGSSTKGMIAESEDRDFYKLQLPTTLAGLPKVRVILEKTTGMNLNIYDNNEQRVTSDNASGKDPVSLSFDGTAGAVYYIVAEFYPGERGAYTLIVKQE